MDSQIFKAYLEPNNLGAVTMSGMIKPKMPWYGVATIVAISILIMQYCQAQYDLSNIQSSVLVGGCVIVIWTIAEKFILNNRS